MDPKNMPEQAASSFVDWGTLLIGAAGFIFTWVVFLIANIQARSRFEGRMEEQAKHLDARIDEVRQDQTRAINSIRTDMNDTFTTVTKAITKISDAMLDADGDPKYLTSKRHAVICKSHQETADIHFANIRKELASIREGQAEQKKNYNDMQDKILRALTSYAKQNGHTTS